jgi:hypothetical protein
MQNPPLIGKGDAMNSVPTINGREMQRFAALKMRPNEDIRSLRLARENATLLLDNTRLRVEYEQLLSSTEIWIRLYEAALARANAASAECSRLQQPAHE